MPLDRASLSRLAAECGLDAVGVAAPVIPRPLAEAFRDRVASGAYAEMAWLPRTAEQRLDPASFLEDARSVIVAALGYGPGEACDAERGGIARYARGWDYHGEVRSRLELLVGRISEMRPAMRSRIAVDAEPVLEKALAVSAGVGRLGKNGLLIVPGHGSWVVLGEIFIDLVLEPDEPIEETCGSCSACIDACPAGALLAPGVLDPSRCRSFLTVERKRSTRGGAGEWLFGCDDCQTCCPANRGARRGSASDLCDAAPPITSEEYLGMDEQAFRERFEGTAVIRGLRRGVRGQSGL